MHGYWRVRNQRLTAEQELVKAKPSNKTRQNRCGLKERTQSGAMDYSEADSQEKEAPFCRW
jgi:hypothetical protein